jgi:hypothetical protein
MTINDRVTCLNFLDGDPVRFTIDEQEKGSEEAVEYMRTSFPYLRSIFREKIQYISEPFGHACRWALKRAWDILPKEPIDQSGTLIEPIGGDTFETTFYQLIAEPNARGIYEGELKVINFFNGPKNPLPHLSLMTTWDMSGPGVVTEGRFWQFGLTPQEFIDRLIERVLLFRYCRPDAISVAPGGEDYHLRHWYGNDTRLPIEVLDSRWLHWIVMGESLYGGTKDSGYFRMQRCGTGNNLRQLDWVGLPEKRKKIVK